jgi:hypothetical protein
MWKIRRPRRSKLCKGLGLFNGVVATLLGWLYYSAKGKMHVLGMVVMVIQEQVSRIKKSELADSYIERCIKKYFEKTKRGKSRG